MHIKVQGTIKEVSFFSLRSFSLFFLTAVFFLLFSIFGLKDVRAGQGCLFCYCDNEGNQWGCMHSCYPNPGWFLCGESDCQGPGGDRCGGGPQPTSTPAPTPSHLACVGTACSLVSGGGSDGCSTSADTSCSSHPITWGTCSRVCGGGTQTGTCDNGSCGTSTVTRPCNTQACPLHLTCVGSSCSIIEDSDGVVRPSTCSAAVDTSCSSHPITWGSCSTTCGPGTQVGTCDNGSCGTSTVTRPCNLGPCSMTCSSSNQCVVGGGGRGCSNDSDCFSHSVCANGTCQTIIGAGSNECSSDANCRHNQCDASGNCTIVNSPGTNTCNSNAECQTALTCDASNRCVVGGGGISCSGNSDCSPTPFITVTPTPGPCIPTYNCVLPLNCYEQDTSCGRGQRYNPGSCNPQAWFKTDEGDDHSNKSIRTDLPLGQRFAKYLVTSTYMSYFSGLREAGNLASEKGWYTRGGYNRRIDVLPENRFFDYYSKANPSEVTITGDLTQTNLAALVSKIAQKNGSLRTATDINLSSGLFVIYIDGNFNVRNDIRVSGSGVIVFVISGNLNIDSAVSEADGVYLVDGIVNTTDVVGANRQLLVKGGVVASGTGKVFGRSRSLSCNFTGPAENFVFEPKYLISLNSKLGKSFVFWREVEP